MTHITTQSAVSPIWPFADGSAAPAIVEFDFAQYYLPGAPVVPLIAALVFDKGGDPSVIITDNVSKAREWLGENSLKFENLANLSACVQAPVICLTDAIRLAPVHIAKPWGQEIWFTGIEARGQSSVTDGNYRMPLPWLLAIGADYLLQRSGGEPNLLKILDPLAEEVFGDLYFELHEEKREVYVVTGVDPRAWPDGVGAIRYGFDQEARRRAGDDATFRCQYLAAVKAYEQIRRAIDSRLDKIRMEIGVGLNEPIDAATLKEWLNRIPRQLQEAESAARELMQSYTHRHPLRLGDVVKVSCLTPHALQHGVRTVEFQTPVYERKILNFGQKVLTQDHWDTEAAVAIMNLDNQMAEDLAVVAASDAYSLEQVVKFDDFQAFRLTLAPGADFSLAMGDSYKLVMAVEGEIHVGSQLLGREEAVLVPRTAGVCRISSSENARAVCLISLPVSADQ